MKKRKDTIENSCIAQLVIHHTASDTEHLHSNHKIMAFYYTSIYLLRASKLLRHSK